ncbi:deoxyribose-phosphate aldolase [Propionicicella superfundia]|uniref:deoxyribose-phosphate aldolase n=1 Tax=Propionicicella superfundia TaxID=348582 RepID=UPI0003F5B458|nr:deoxyribose-phosphate aldolase [Propionicicella superfundia]
MITSEFAGLVDHAVLAPDVTNEGVRAAYRFTAEAGCGSLVVNGSNVKFASILARGTGVRVGAVVGGFPLGRVPTSVKAFEAAEAVRFGADELTVMMNIGAFLECSPDYLLKEVGDAVRIADGRTVKVTLETGYLTDQQKLRAALICADAGAGFVVTSTGFGPTAATPQDVALLRDGLPAEVEVEAAGDIRTWAEAKALLDAGAARLTTPSAAELLADVAATTGPDAS